MGDESGFGKDVSSALSRLDFIVIAVLAVIVVVMLIWGMV